MEQVYLFSKKNLKFKQGTKQIKLGDLFDIYPEKIKNNLLDLSVKEIKNCDAHQEIIKLGDVINAISSKNYNVKINFANKEDLLISFDKKQKDKTRMLRVILVSFILLLGSAMAIINFHADVNMKESHIILYRILTGEKSKNMFWLQIPYSIGIGIGVLTFYNRLIPNYSKKEPTPLELEIDTYKNEVQTYIVNNQQNENEDKN